VNDDERWDLWAGAVIDCEIDGDRRRLSGADAGTPPATPLFVLTAYNPGGEARDRDRNEADQRRLERELIAIGVSFWPADGQSVDGSWSEPGVAVGGLDRAEACELGRRYGQLAVYELDEHDVHVVRCADSKVVRTRARRR